MAWNARLKTIIDDSSEFDSIKIQIEYYNKLGSGSFIETFQMNVESNFETIRQVVLKKLAIINIFRAKVDQLKEFIGQSIESINLEKAIQLGLEVGKPIAK